MLILTRRANETICIADNIEVTVLQIRGGQVRLGITAPKEISVHREEVQILVNEQKAQTHSKASSKKIYDVEDDVDAGQYY